MRKLWIIIFIFFGLVTSQGPIPFDLLYAHAAEINVYPGQSIQSAIDTSLDFDEIIIHQGTYYENINFKGKAITLRSTNPDDPLVVTTTCIDGNQVARVVTFNRGESQNSILSGLTVQNGKTEKSGGGIICRESSPTVSKCIITQNIAGACGGGIFCQESFAYITECAIVGNAAEQCGGGAFCKDSAPIIAKSIIIENEVGGCGGGICCKESFPTISNSIFTTNFAPTGAGISCKEGSAPTIINCTLTGNFAYSYGGSILCDDESSPVAINCILWGNFPDEIFLLSGTPTVSYSDIQNGYPGIGNINADPLFVSPEIRDYHLQEGSPCIDSGTNTGAPPEDKDGVVRPQDGNSDGILVSDMGAYEYLSALTFIY